MLITLNQLEKAIPGSSDRKRTALIRILNEQMQLMDITTPERISAYISTLAYISENLHILPDISEFFNKWDKEYCNSLADIGSFSAILHRMSDRSDLLCSVEQIEPAFKMYRKCWEIFGVVNV